VQVDFAADELPNLHEVLAELAAQGPIAKIQFAGQPIWLISGYREAKSLMKDDEYLSAPAAYDELLKPSMGEVLATMTGQQHRHNRAAIANVFFPRKIRQLADTIFTQEASKLCDHLTGEREADLVSQYTRPYTFNNIARLLGLPAEDVGILQGWAERIMQSYIDLPSAVGACQEMGEYLAPLVVARRSAPADDIISLLIEIEVEGRGLSNEEIFAFCRNLFPAAIDTSTNTLGTALSVVLAQPELRPLLADNKSLEGLVQEVLRWEPPLVMVPRKCIKPFELNGATISVGDDVRICISAANDDPTVFVNPRIFDPNRDEGNLTFGHGEHFCIGSHMARRVVETGLAVLVKRFPNMELIAERPVEVVGGVLRGPKDVWVRL